MLGNLYVDAFVCPSCARVYLFKSREGVRQCVCEECHLIIDDDTPNATVVKDIELWQK